MPAAALSLICWITLSWALSAPIRSAVSLARAASSFVSASLRSSTSLLMLDCRSASAWLRAANPLTTVVFRPERLLLTVPRVVLVLTSSEFRLLMLPALVLICAALVAMLLVLVPMWLVLVAIAPVLVSICANAPFKSAAVVPSASTTTLSVVSTFTALTSGVAANAAGIPVLTTTAAANAAMAALAYPLRAYSETTIYACRTSLQMTLYVLFMITLLS